MRATDDIRVDRWDGYECKTWEEGLLTRYILYIFKYKQKIVLDT